VRVQKDRTEAAWWRACQLPPFAGRTEDMTAEKNPDNVRPARAMYCATPRTP
jgi:hypothetical protein